MGLGRVGIWRRHHEGVPPLREIEELGFTAIWVGGSPTLEEVRPFLEQSTTLTVLTGVLNVWRHAPADVATGHALLRGDFGDRFLLGVGVGHPEVTGEYTKPLTKMREFLDGLDSADPPVPKDERVTAALGPKMLELAGQRSLGAHPYFTTADHTRFARERVGPEALLAPEVAVVVDPDPESGRRTARAYAALYLQLSNYVDNLRKFGFTEHDIANGGSDRLIDAVIPHGAPEAVADALQAHFDAGADHVCLQLLTDEAKLVDDLRALARVLL